MALEVRDIVKLASEVLTPDDRSKSKRVSEMRRELAWRRVFGSPMQLLMRIYSLVDTSALVYGECRKAAGLEATTINRAVDIFDGLKSCTVGHEAHIQGAAFGVGYAVLFGIIVPSVIRTQRRINL
jgi:hypothetical protein